MNKILYFIFLLLISSCGEKKSLEELDGLKSVSIYGLEELSGSSIFEVNKELYGQLSNLNSDELKRSIEKLDELYHLNCENSKCSIERK